VKSRKVFLDEMANREFDDACEYYELEMPGLGKRFRHEIKQAIRRIREYPEAWAIEKNDVRKYLLHKFPYKILYSIEPDYIYIIAVAHCHGRPDYWIDRIPDQS
jgi:toxin ParE2